MPIDIEFFDSLSGLLFLGVLLIAIAIIPGLISRKKNKTNDSLPFCSKDLDPDAD